MTDERCENCRFWSEFDNGEGFCRRYPPVMVAWADGTHENDEYLQPTTCLDDWCGEFRSKDD